MIDNLIIVGCGTVGANLSIKLAQEKLISNLDIYDFDVIGEVPAYPFKEYETGISKVKITKFLCLVNNKHLVVNMHEEKVTNKFSDGFFIIDCRDNKTENINASIKLSLDGCMLYIDSTKSNKTNKNYHHYISTRNELYINKAIDVIIDYLKAGEYIHKDMKLYDLEHGDSSIIKRESDCAVKKQGDHKSKKI